MLTPEQYTALSALWAETQFPTTHQRVELAERISMRPRTVQVWFQNQRQKTKRQSVLQAGSASNSAHHISTNNEQTFSTHMTHSSQSPIYGTYSYHHSIVAPAAHHHSTSTPSSHPFSSTSVYNPSGHKFSAPAEPALPTPLPPVKTSVTAPPITIDIIVHPTDRKPPYFPPTSIVSEPGHRTWDLENRPSHPFDKQVQWGSPSRKPSWPVEHPIHHPLPSSSFPFGDSSTAHRSQSTHPHPPWGPPSPVRRQSLGHYHTYGSSVGDSLHSIRPLFSEPLRSHQSQSTRRQDPAFSSAPAPFPSIPKPYPTIPTSPVLTSTSTSGLIPDVPAFESSATTFSSTTTTTTMVLNANSINQSPTSRKLPSFREFLQSTVSSEADQPDPIQMSLAESGKHNPHSSSSSSASFAPPIPVSSQMYPFSSLERSFGSRSEYNPRSSA
ncbi:Transcription factor, contains HOX domain [Phaffia rhodozyma]|uniref:Transcription factor, contains HOX domain n=1 Tax=Phaffia rhodozyma TaxID=264483 RepID=A0A0F7SR18_PHARH|nr:Transcription factor, contains HOX domain [Phaffia rhodozyma]